MKQWYPIETRAEYDEAVQRLEEIYLVKKGSPDHKEKLLLSLLINKHETEKYPIGEIDPVEFIKIRMEDFGFNASDLAKAYGDKGTVSKVLNYKQALSLTMIRKFSMLLRIPVEALIKEYKLHS